MYKLILIFWIIFFTILISSCDEEDSITLPIGDPPVYPLVDEFPAWSPDGQHILYNHYGITRIDIGGSYHVDPDSSGLWIIDSDGTNPRILLKNAYNGTWAPDGKWIVFVQGARIYKANINKDKTTLDQIEQLTFVGESFFPSISKDGQWIAFDSNKDSPNGMNFIWKMKADGSNKERISYDPSTGEMRMPNWSPSGDKIVHQKYIEIGSPEIFVINNNGTDLSRLTFNNADDRYPQYAPKDNKIIFQSNSNVWLMTTDGTNLIQLTANGGGTPSWSPDGQKIVFVGFSDKEYDPENNGTLYVMNIDGGNRQQLTYGPK